MKNKILYILVFTLLSVYEIVSLAHVAYQSGISINGNFIPFFEREMMAEVSIAIFFVITIISFFINNRSIRSGVSKSLFVFSGYVYIISFLCSLSNPFDTVSTYVTILVPLLAFFFFFNYGYRVGEKMVLISVCILFILLAYAYYVTYNVRLSELLTLHQEYAVSNASYFLVYLLPFILCIKGDNKGFTVFKWLAILITLIVCLSSFKRGSTVCLGIGVILYLLELNSGARKNNTAIKTLLLSALLVIGVIYLYKEFTELSGGGLNQRFESVSESNRIDIYRVTIKMIFSSNIIRIFFGHGWSMVVKDSPMEYSAHNDFLELFYDAGFIGLILFVVLLISLWKWYKILHRRKSSYAAPLLASYGVFFFGMLFSHILIFPYYFSLLCMTWGYIYGFDHVVINPIKDISRI